MGKPSEDFVRIVGTVDENNLLVETETGDNYSVKIYPWHSGRAALPTPIEWKKEENTNIQPYSPRTPFTKFLTFPLLVRVKQVYEMKYSETELETQFKFALSENGDLWMWNYGRGSLSGLTLIFFPAIWLVIEGFIALIVIIINSVRRKINP